MHRIYRPDTKLDTMGNVRVSESCRLRVPATKEGADCPSLEYQLEYGKISNDSSQSLLKAIRIRNVKPKTLRQPRWLSRS